MSEDFPHAHRERSSGVRASDEDRERLAGELREHTIAGRLTADELERRLEVAYAAHTTAELDTLRRDLPASGTAAALGVTDRRRHLRRRIIQETGGALSLFVVGSAVWLASGAPGQFWPVWILVVVVLSLVRNGWALYGPAPDLEAVERQMDARRERRVARRDRRGRRRLGP